jgi:hypothetical protein
MDNQIRRVHKAFKAIEAKAVETQRLAPVILVVGDGLLPHGMCQAVNRCIMRFGAGYPQHIGTISPKRRILSYSRVRLKWDRKIQLDPASADIESWCDNRSRHEAISTARTL